MQSPTFRSLAWIRSKIDASAAEGGVDDETTPVALSYEIGHAETEGFETAGYGAVFSWCGSGG